MHRQKGLRREARFFFFVVIVAAAVLAFAPRRAGADEILDTAIPELARALPPPGFLVGDIGRLAVFHLTGFGFHLKPTGGSNIIDIYIRCSDACESFIVYCFCGGATF